MLPSVLSSVSKTSRGLGRIAPILLIGLLITGCGRGDDAEPEAVIRPVHYAQVFSAGSERTSTFAGIAQSASRQNLSFRVPGTIQQVRVDVGDRVGRGQTLAILDPADYLLQRQQAEAGVAQARAQERNAQAAYERVLSLYENENASLSDLDAARASFESAEAMQASAASGLNLSRQQVGYTRLSAPVRGAVADVLAEANETVSAGHPVIVLESAGLPEVEVAVPEALIGSIRSGSDVTVTFDAIPGAEYEAFVAQVGIATAAGGTFPVVVRLRHAATQVLPGMAAEVAFAIQSSGTSTGAILVPSQAVIQDQHGAFVYVLNRDGEEEAVAERRDVEVGALTAEGLEVFGGLEDGDLVVAAGLNTIVNQQRVRLLDSSN